MNETWKDFEDLVDSEDIDKQTGHKEESHISSACWLLIGYYWL